MRWLIERFSALLRLRQRAVLPLLGVVFMIWSLIEPTPMPRMAAVTVGQALGTAAFAIYVFLAVRELRGAILSAHSRDRS